MAGRGIAEGGGGRRRGRHPGRGRPGLGARPGAPAGRAWHASELAPIGPPLGKGRGHSPDGAESATRGGSFVPPRTPFPWTSASPPASRFPFSGAPDARARSGHLKQRASAELQQSLEDTPHTQSHVTLRGSVGAMNNAGEAPLFPRRAGCSRGAPGGPATAREAELGPGAMAGMERPGGAGGSILEERGCPAAAATPGCADQVRPGRAGAPTSAPPLGVLIAFGSQQD